MVIDVGIVQGPGAKRSAFSARSVALESRPNCPKTTTSPFLAQAGYITGFGTVSL